VDIAHDTNQKLRGENMGGENFILSYVQSCIGGNVAFSDCGPVWQLGVIAALLVAAFMILILLVTGSQEQSVHS